MKFLTRSIVSLIVLTTILTTGVAAQNTMGRAGERILDKASEAAMEAKTRRNIKSDEQGPTSELISAATYAFTPTTAAMEDMSTGTTQIVAASQDDTASAVTAIGFEVWVDGVRYTQFSANANGLMGLGGVAVNNGASGRTNDFATTTNNPKMTGYWDDMCTGAAGKVHYKVVGAPGSRKLIVEWLNMVQFDNVTVACSTTVRGSVQVWLFEGTGVIQTVTGGMSTNDNGNGGYSVGIGSSSTSFASVTTSTNSVSYAASSNANIAALAAGTSYLFTPNVPSAPTNNGVTAITPTSLTLNWIDTSSNEVGFVIYRSIDNINFSFIAQTAANATSYADSGLLPSSNYFYRVFAVTEGALSTAATFTPTTAPAGNDTCNGAGGLWSAAGTWADGTPPTAGDNVTIGSGCTVTIDTAAIALDVTVDTGGILQFEDTTARTLTVTNVTVNGTLRSGVAGTQTSHVVSLSGNLTNNGTIDFSTNSNTAGAGFTFTGINTASVIFSPTSNTDFKQTGGLIVNKGTNNTPILSFFPQGTLTVLGANAVGFLTITNGTFKLDGSAAFSNPLFSAAAYTIPATGGLWINDPNATVVGLNGSPTVTGLFRVMAGTYNIGTATGNSMGFATGANILVEGGAVNATGRFGVAAAANVITYNQTGGTVTVCTIGNASATLGSFDLGTGLTSTISLSGGTIVTQLAATAIDYRNQAGGGVTGVTGGTLQLGNASSGAAKTFNLRGVMPNVVVTNTSAGHTAQMGTTLVNYNNLGLNININSGATFNFGNVAFLWFGTTLTNDGTFTHNGASSNFVTFQPAAPQTITGSGTFTAPLTNIGIQSDSGLILTTTQQIPVTAIRLFSGSVTNANKFTLGNGGATTGIVQIGNTTTPTAAGTFDVALTFNLGSGGQNVSYLRTTASRTTGPEINPTRILNALTYDDNDPTHTLTIAGGNLTNTGILALTNGVVLTGNNVVLTNNGTATRTTGYVDGNLARSYAVIGTYTFFVGQGAFTPVTANVTALGIVPSTLTARSFNATLAGFSPSQSLSRNWSLEETGDLTADLTFVYDVDANDVNGNEADYRIYRREASGVATDMCGAPCVNTATNTLGPLLGVSSFSRWTGAELITPTAALAGISGRTLTADGRPIKNVTIVLSGGDLAQPRYALTSNLGYYTFDELPVGQNYVVSTSSKRFTFANPAHLINLQQSMSDQDFIAEPEASSRAIK